MMENSTDESQEIVYIERNGVQICDTNILAELCEEAGQLSNDIKNCLQIYTLNTPTKQLKSMYSHIKKPLIIRSLTFLNASDRNWADYKKEACLHELICRI